MDGKSASSKHWEANKAANLRISYQIRDVEPRDYIVHLYGDTAVVNYRATTHEQFGDTDIVSEQRRTETYIKQSGSWLLVAIQWDNLPVNLRKPVAVADRKAYADYVGQYQWRPNDDLDNIIVKKDGSLWSQIGEDQAELFPAGGETFFVRDGDIGSTTFSRDAGSRVTGYTYRRVDGQEIHVKKIK